MQKRLQDPESELPRTLIEEETLEGPFPHATGQDVTGTGRHPSQPRRNQHAAL